MGIISINLPLRTAERSESTPHSNVENSNFQGDHNTLNSGASLPAARQKELTERYLRALAEEWQFLTVSVHGEDRHQCRWIL